MPVLGLAMENYFSPNLYSDLALKLGYKYQEGQVLRLNHFTSLISAHMPPQPSFTDQQQLRLHGI